MEVTTRKLLWTIKSIFLAACISGLSHGQDISKVSEICKDATNDSRSMAKVAGYDIDELCGELNSSVLESNQNSQPVPSPALPRKTVSSYEQEEFTKNVLPVAVSGTESALPEKILKPFGFDLFANTPNTFTPTNNIPVPSDYLLGPNDTLEILFYGKTNSSFSLAINRDGSVDFPGLGPVGLAGLTFTEAKEMLQTRIANQMIGTKASISMGNLRSMQIFVLGEAYKPGAYTISSLSTITHALISSGGVSDIASLRNIQLKRSGKLVSTLDLYDLLIFGDTSKDVRLQASDVIYIPTVDGLVSIDGQVLRPAIYELKGEATATDLIELAGGLGSKAFPQSARIERINDDGFMTVVDVDLTKADGQSLILKEGDYLRIDSIVDRKESIVTLTGHVYHPGEFKWREGMRVSDILGGIEKFPPSLDLNYALISRETKPIGDLEVIEIDLQEILFGNDPVANIKLSARDTIHIFSKNTERGSELVDVLSKVKSQVQAGELEKVVSISGTVRLPGEYPLTEGMRVSDLVESAGNFTVEHTPYDYGILVRTTLPRGDVKVINLSIDKFSENKNSPSNFSLMPGDKILLFARDEDRAERLELVLSKLKEQASSVELSNTVEVAGTVKYPGEYPLAKGMDISALVKAAGGFTDAAYTQAGELSRVNLSNPEIAEIISIPFSIKGDESVSELELKSLDRVSFRAIPEFRETRKITLQGEVKFPGDYYFEQGELLGSVIQRAGGFTDFAHIEASFFTRESLKVIERQEIQRLKRLLNEQILVGNLEDFSVDSVVINQQLDVQRQAIQELESAEAVGRLVIPLRDIMAMRANDILLEEGDRLIVPKFRQEVTILGEVHRPVSYLFDPRLSIGDYLEKSGGIKDDADLNALYIVKASGEIIVPKRNLFKFIGPSEKIQPGDTIVVPLDTDLLAVDGIPLISEVSKIIYQIALGAAALKSF
jgi:polysaccharide export outer membrane protein